MTTKKANIMFIAFSLLQVICLIGVILCENTTVDLCIIGVQAIALMTQIGITIADNKKSKKKAFTK